MNDSPESLARWLYQNEPIFHGIVECIAEAAIKDMIQMSDIDLLPIAVKDILEARRRAQHEDQRTAT